MTILYGIKTCDNVKRAGKWLKEHDIEYQFHDVREHGLTQELLQTWLVKSSWEALLNKRSLSWKNLAAEQKENLTEAKVMALFLATPTLIKRPVLSTESHFFIGFKPEDYQTLL